MPCKRFAFLLRYAAREISLRKQNNRIGRKTARLTDGTLAGSASDLMDILKKCVSFGIPLEEAVRAATHTPASAAGAADIKGSISPGKHADFLVLDNGLNLLKVFSYGIPVI